MTYSCNPYGESYCSCKLTLLRPKQVEKRTVPQRFDAKKDRIVSCPYKVGEKEDNSDDLRTEVVHGVPP